MPGLLQPARKLTWSPDGRLLRAEVQSITDGTWDVMETDSPDSPYAVTREQWNAW